MVFAVLGIEDRIPLIGFTGIVGRIRVILSSPAS